MGILARPVDVEAMVGVLDERNPQPAAGERGNQFFELQEGWGLCRVSLGYARGMKPWNVLFLCTGNSARSILAEAYLNARGERRFVAHSAGSHPTGRVNPYALELLERHGIPTQGLRSKSWDEFARQGAPRMDVIITVCDQAAGEQCPFWPGQPATAHWGIPDPAAVEGTEDDKRKAFETAFGRLRARIDRFLALPIESLDRAALRDRLARIGQRTDP